MRYVLIFFIFFFSLVSPSPVFAQKKAFSQKEILNQVQKTVEQRSQSPAPNVSPSPTPRASALPKIIDTLPDSKQIDKTVPAIINPTAPVEPEQAAAPKVVWSFWDNALSLQQHSSGQWVLSVRTWRGASLVLAVIFLKFFFWMMYIKLTQKSAFSQKKYKIRRITL